MTFIIILVTSVFTQLSHIDMAPWKKKSLLPIFFFFVTVSVTFKEERSIKKERESPDQSGQVGPTQGFHTGDWGPVPGVQFMLIVVRK